MTLPSLLSRSSKRHTLEESHIIADLCRLANNHPHAMVDEKPAADLRRGMDFNARERTSGLANSPGNKRDAVRYQPMSHTVGQQGMKARIRHHDFKPAGGCRISVEDRAQICSNGLQHV